MTLEKALQEIEILRTQIRESEERYALLQKTSTHTKSVALRGLLRGIRGYVQYELQDVLDVLSDDESDMATVIKTRATNILKRLDAMWQKAQ